MDSFHTKLYHHDRLGIAQARGAKNPVNCINESKTVKTSPLERKNELTTHLVNSLS